MRTTLTLDDDVVLAIKRRRKAKGEMSFKEAVNAAIREGIEADSETMNKSRSNFELKGRLLHSSAAFNFHKAQRLAEFAENDPDF